MVRSKIKSGLHGWVVLYRCQFGWTEKIQQTGMVSEPVNALHSEMSTLVKSRGCVNVWHFFSSTISAEFLLSEEGGQNIVISDAFIKGRRAKGFLSFVDYSVGRHKNLTDWVTSQYVLAESLFNRRVEEKPKEMLFTPLGWHHSSLDQLREENGEKKAMERLLCV